MRKGDTLMSKVMRYLPTGAAVAGMIMVLGSIVFTFETDYGRIGGVTGGMLVLLAAVWFAANPFLKNRRRYSPLRTEVNKFIKLATQLNRAAISSSPEQIERIQAAMHESIAPIVEAAGKTE